jgi:hypothetical protein
MVRERGQSIGGSLVMYKSLIAQFFTQTNINAHACPSDSRSPKIESDWQDEYRGTNKQTEFVQDNYCRYPANDPRMKIKVKGN